jgi:hypothetical protein
MELSNVNENYNDIKIVIDTINNNSNIISVKNNFLISVEKKSNYFKSKLY